MNKETIHRLIKDYILNRITRQELIQFLDGFNEEEIQEQYEIVLRSYFDELMASAGESLETEDSKSKAREITRGKLFYGILRVTYMYKLAASVAILLGLFWVGQQWFKEDSGKAALAEVTYKNDFVPKGAKRDVLLKDGTLVKLNSDSKLSYPEEFDKEARNVKLTGEAFFDVERDESRPFTINTSAFDIRVLGTSFNVEVHEAGQKAAVSVKTGKVRISLLQSEEVYELTKNKKLILDLSTGDVTLQDTDVDLALKWTKGILYFNKTPFTEVEKSLERWYNIDIDIKDNSLNNKKLSGQHSNETLEEVLETLAYLLEFKYEIDGDKVTIKKM
ncbi:FecR family protein [Arcticibacterium luteifluviistationis]|uniref:Iron dicitrate transport regulator FecR n=1 Tax=Arcticibacterium luteifluviistationis TaxID=1784714 RepID=A0A2Z4G7L9_9BACT|nr:FecR domain-containing protein [Arcticibacterium luteifluviistationis]AWV97058.1 hypothetical protein DJ013_02245 [Arcticibacterium luteifluviistationis]